MHAKIVSVLFLVLVGPLLAVEVGPAGALLIKRRESHTIHSRQEGETLFAITTEEFPKKSLDERLVWRREEFGTLNAQRQQQRSLQQGPSPQRNSQVNLAEAWNMAFKYIRENQAAVQGTEIIDVEPDFLAYSAKADESGEVASPPNAAASDYLVSQLPMPYWPQFSGEWGHLGDDYSQLHAAYELVRSDASAIPVRVAILDVGFLAYHRAFPSNLPPPFADMAQQNRPAGGGLPGEPLFPPKTFINGPTHGTATAAILAAPAGTYQHAGTLHRFSGGNPGAILVPIRIGPAVVSLPLPVPKLSRTSDVAMGFVHASQANVKVLSMSVGGLPSGALASAVNEAYAAGIALFCASGDFVYHKSGLKTPWYLVYPAVYDNVVAVTGVTADQTSYGLPPGNNWKTYTDSLVLGSFGPRDRMDRAIAAWGPNVPWAALPAALASEPYPPGQGSPWNIGGADWNRLDLDGQGTSANTPQVAAAASLFIAKHQARLTAEYPQPWQKVELVYTVLQRSAKPVGDDARIFFGNGYLKARDALEFADWPKSADLRRRTARNGFYWLQLLFSAALPLPKAAEPDPKLRAGMASVLGNFLSDLPGGAKPGDPYTQTVLVGIETEISQHVAASAVLQERLDQLPQPLDKAARKEFIGLLLKESFSEPTRSFLEKTRAL